MNKFNSTNTKLKAGDEVVVIAGRILVKKAILEK